MSEERGQDGPGARFGRLAGKAVRTGRQKARDLQGRDHREMAEEAKDAASRAAKRAAEFANAHEEEIRTAAQIGGRAMMSGSRVGAARMAAQEVAREMERRKRSRGGGDEPSDRRDEGDGEDL